MAELLERAQALVAAGPYDARPAEIAAVHAAIYPDRDAVCQTCRGELGRAYYAIQRWATQQGAAGTAHLSSTPMKQNSVARFKSSDTIYMPHGLGVAYSNANLTDKVARYILENDPDAKALFSELPPAEGEGEDEQQLTPAQQSAEKALDKAASAVQQVPADFDYTKLASAMVDEIERRNQEATAKSAQQRIDASSEQPALTASAGGAADESHATDKKDNSDSNSDTSDSDGHDEAKPASLSRANKEQLVATYTVELGQAPAEGLTNEELRTAIAEKRASLQDPE